MKRASYGIKWIDEGNVRSQYLYRFWSSQSRRASQAEWVSTRFCASEVKRAIRRFRENINGPDRIRIRSVAH